MFLGLILAACGGERGNADEQSIAFDWEYLGQDCSSGLAPSCRVDVVVTVSNLSQDALEVREGEFEIEHQGRLGAHSYCSMPLRVPGLFEGAVEPMECFDRRLIPAGESASGRLSFGNMSPPIDVNALAVVFQANFLPPIRVVASNSAAQEAASATQAAAGEVTWFDLLGWLPDTADTRTAIWGTDLTVLAREAGMDWPPPQASEREALVNVLSPASINNGRGWPGFVAVHLLGISHGWAEAYEQIASSTSIGIRDVHKSMRSGVAPTYYYINQGR